MTIDFYYAASSPPCRAVLLAAKAVGVELNLKEVDLMKGAHLTPEYRKMNPQHTVPTLVDDGLVLSESRAIMIYLASKYGKDDSLYPKDDRKRAVVNQRLFFDAGTLYSRYADYYFPVYFAGAAFDAVKLEKLKDAFSVLNTILENSEYVAGDKLTLADLSLVAGISSAEASSFDMSGYTNILKWYQKVKKTAPGYEEANGKNLELFKQMVDHVTGRK